MIPLQARLRYQEDGLSEKLAELITKKGGPVSRSGIKAVFDLLISFGDGGNSSATSTITEHAAWVSAEAFEALLLRLVLGRYTNSVMT